MKQISTTDGSIPETKLTPLALEMLGSKKKDNSLNVLVLSLNDRGERAQIIPKMLDALCTGNLTQINPFNQQRSASSPVLHNLREHAWKRWTFQSSSNITKTTVTSNTFLTRKNKLYSKTPSSSQDPSTSSSRL